MTRQRVLIVDDDPVSHTLLQAMLGAEDWQIDYTHSGEEALDRLRATAYDVVLTDVLMPGMDGIELLSRVRKLCPQTPVVVMTAYNSPSTVTESIRNLAYGYLSKPFRRGDVIETLRRALEGSAAPDDIEVISARPGWISMRLRCKMSTAERLAQFLDELAADLSREDRDAISTAFRELLLNAIEHGGKSDPQQQVTLAYIRGARSIIYYVRDPGEGFSFDKLPHAAVSNRPEDPFEHAGIRSQMGMRPGGFGILLTREFADELLYSEKGNEVILIKYLG